MEVSSSLVPSLGLTYSMGVLDLGLLSLNVFVLKVSFSFEPSIVLSPRITDFSRELLELNCS